MKTVLELQNEAREALAKAQQIAADPSHTEASYDAAWSDFTAKKTAFERGKQLADADDALGTPSNQIPDSRDLRNPSDADWIPGVSKDVANLDPSKFVQVANNVIVPVANKDTEGWIKNYPVAVQHPSILARLSPELRHEKAQQEAAFAAYFRRGHAWVARNRPALLPFLNALQEDTDSEGGYLVPTDQRFEIIRNPGTPGGVLRPRSSVFTTTRDGGTWPTATSVTWAGIAEEAENSDSDPAFNQVPFTIRKSGANNRLSMELLADSAVNIPALLGVLYGESKGRYEDQQGIEGDGTTEPGGLRTTLSPQGAISDITDVFADPPTALEVIKAYFELPAQWRSNMSWFLTSSLMAKIVAIGSAAAGIHFIEMLGGEPGLTLLGRPVFMFDGTGWDDAATISGGEELGAIGDFRQYFFIDRLDMTVARDDSRYFEKDQVAFKARSRYDSLYSIADAFRILKA